MRDDLATVLLRGRNVDGGWGYYPEKSSRLEPTAWAVLALNGPTAVADVTDVLRHWPARDALLVERAGGDANYAFHGLALLSILARGIEHSTGNASLVKGIQSVKGVALEPSTHSRQNNTLQAWSWIADTFSWVEPTAWCLLSLKKWAQRPGARVDAGRIDEAERLLIDRSCLSGGWNYGNSNMLGQELRPYVPTTAIALLAMQDRLTHPVVQRSLSYLEHHATSERSGTALALALLALRACGRRYDSVQAVLLDQLAVTTALRSHAAIALVCFALGPEQAHAAFML